MNFEDLKWAMGELVHAFRAPASCDCPTHARLVYAPKQAGAREERQPMTAILCEDPETHRQPPLE